VTTITLSWMNLIRKAREQHVSDKEIVDALFRTGLAEEKRIEQHYKESAIELKRQAKIDLQTIRALSKEVRAIKV
jgi:hypothetical protein